MVHCSNPSASSSTGSGAGFSSSPYVPFQQRSGGAAKTYLGTGTGYKMAQCKEASGAPVDSSTRDYGRVTAVRDGTRSTWAIASPGQIPSSAGQWSGWGRQGVEGMLGTTSLSPSTLDQSPSEGHSAEMLCSCLPKKRVRFCTWFFGTHLLPSLPSSLPLFGSFTFAAVLLLEFWLAPSSGNYTLSSGI